jgi:hypothetical protein
LHVTSGTTSDVVPGQFTARTPPSVTGVPQVDQPLTASAGMWTPPGKISYQWLADGKAIDGATGTVYTPTPGDVRKDIAVRVTVHQKGYDDAVATSVATDGVAPGTFLNTGQPTISGTAQVGVPLTAARGAWSPHPTITYQWLVDNEAVPNATDKTFTPRPQDLGKKVTVEVFASRPGYLTASVPSSSTAAVLPGVMHNHKAPLVSGHAVVGRTLRTTDGTWSIKPDSYRYQWYAGHTKITGATDATYDPTPAVAGERIHVVVTARRDGYTSLSASSENTDRVVLGRIAFAKPTIGGHAVVGRTVTARLDDLAPSSATAHYHWYRDDRRIPGANEAAYVVQPGDLGHRLHVEVTVREQNWVPRTRHSASVGDVRTRPQLHAHTSLRQGRVFLKLVVSAPGLATVAGQAKVLLGGHRIGLFTVTDGRGSRLLGLLHHGTHTLTIVYHGGAQEMVGRKTITVTVP